MYTNILSKYKSILSKYKNTLSDYTKYTFKIDKDSFKVHKYTFKVQKYTLEEQKYTFKVQVYFRNTKVYFQSTKVHSGSTQVYFQSTKVYCGGKNPKARLLRVLFHSIDLLALFGVYAGIIFFQNHGHMMFCSPKLTWMSFDALLSWGEVNLWSYPWHLRFKNLQRFSCHLGLLKKDVLLHVSPLCTHLREPLHGLRQLWPLGHIHRCWKTRKNLGSEDTTATPTVRLRTEGATSKTNCDDLDFLLAWICTNAVLGNFRRSWWSAYAGHHTTPEGSKLTIHLIKKYLETCSVSSFHWLRSCRLYALCRLNWFHMASHACWEERNRCRNIEPYKDKKQA